MANAGRPATRQPLSRERIIHAAVRLADRDGVDALSMRRLAAELGVEAMSLYNHIPNKAAVLDGVIEVVLNEINVTGATAGHWEDRFRIMAGEFRRVALAHPKSFTLVFTRRVGSTAALRPVQTAMAALADAGFDTATSVHALRALVAFQNGSLVREFSLTAGSPTGQSQPPEPLTHRVGKLRGSGLPPITTTSYDLAVYDHEEEYWFGVELLLSGLRQLLESRRQAGEELRGNGGNRHPGELDRTLQPHRTELTA